ncbi:MAG: phytanoyl-CoA dioxygenase family protein [Shimia sp.]
MYYTEADCDPAAFTQLIDRHLSASDVPRAQEIQKNIPIYAARDLDTRDPAVLTEWAWVLGEGPGVLALKGAYADPSVLDAATAIYMEIIAAEAGGGGEDHFAASGANARVWNSLQKLCLADPAIYAHVFGNAAIDGVCRAWLGPAYQMTAQVNLVRPGGQAQTAHCDYHLGFQTMEGAKAFPSHIHHLSPALTLQGAIAHVDMPLKSGPTKLLPFSQTYGPGYLAYRLPEFAQLFEDRHVQLPLAKGDCLFFNPALFHAAGENRSTDIERFGNLIQVSSAMGRAMEALDRDAMCRALYPVLADAPEGVDVQAAIAATAEGYPFPTNLDSDPRKGGLAPPSQADLMRDALARGDSADAFGQALDALNARRMP